MSDGALKNQLCDSHLSCLRLVLCGYDATVFPSNATYVRQSITALATILGMGSDFCGHYQVPVFQSQTTMSAMVKHRRLIEDQLIANKLSIVNSFQLLYSKEESTARDTRALSQQCIGLVHGNFPESSWLASRVLVEGKLGPVPLLPFNQFLGYDDTTRPGASARVEQMLSRMFQTACVLFTFVFLGEACSRHVWVNQMPVRKGLEAHKQVLQGFMSGMDFRADDRLLFVDLVPNRLCILKQGACIGKDVGVLSFSRCISFYWLDFPMMVFRNV